MSVVPYCSEFLGSHSLEITVQGKLCIALVWQAFFLSYPFYYYAFFCVKCTLAKSILK